MINLLCPKHIVLNTKITIKYSANLWSKISFFPRSIWHAFDSWRDLFPYLQVNEDT